MEKMITRSVPVYDIKIISERVGPVRDSAGRAFGPAQVPLDECHLFPNLPGDTNPLRGTGDWPIPVRTVPRAASL